MRSITMGRPSLSTPQKPFGWACLHTFSSCQTNVLSMCISKLLPCLHEFRPHFLGLLEVESAGTQEHQLVGIIEPRITMTNLVLLHPLLKLIQRVLLQSQQVIPGHPKQQVIARLQLAIRQGRQQSFVASL